MVVFQLTHVILSITVPKYSNLGVSNTTVLTYNSGIAEICNRALQGRKQTVRETTPLDALETSVLLPLPAPGSPNASCFSWLRVIESTFTLKCCV